MLACHEILDLISVSLDNQLSEYERAILDEHLKQCPACSALFAELQGLHTASTQLEDLPAPEGFSKRVMECIAANPSQETCSNIVPFPSKKSFYRSWQKWAVSAAAIAIVILGAVTLPGLSAINDGGSPAWDLLTADSTTRSESNGAETSSEDSVSPATYCGTLILTTDTLPEGLDQYPHTTEDGNTVYVVPADYFFSLKEQGFFPAGDSTNLTLGSPNALTGRIVIKKTP